MCLCVETLGQGDKACIGMHEGSRLLAEPGVLQRSRPLCRGSNVMHRPETAAEGQQAGMSGEPDKVRQELKADIDRWALTCNVLETRSIHVAARRLEANSQEHCICSEHILCHVLPCLWTAHSCRLPGTFPCYVSAVTRWSDMLRGQSAQHGIS